MTMTDEKLEFSAQDLGRLARHIGDLSGVLEWLDIHGTDPDDMRRVRRAAFEGYNEAKR